MINGFDDIQKMSKDNVDLALKSFGALSKGMQTLAAEMADYSKSNYENSTAAFEKVVGANSVDKAFEAQAEYVRVAYEECVGQLTKLGEMYTGIAKDAFQPFEAVVGKVTKK